MSRPYDNVIPAPIKVSRPQGSIQPDAQASTQVPSHLTKEYREGSSLTSEKSPDWLRLAEAELTRLAEGARQGSIPGLDQLNSVATGIVDSLHGNDRLLSQVLNGSSAPPLVTNPIHVSVVATKLGLGLGWNREELCRLALAGLLHDIGMVSLPESLLMKPEPLSSSERTFMEQHPEFGAELLRGLGSTFDWLVQVVLQEHERWSGQGYPNKLRGSEIHPFAQLIGIADVFDALVSFRHYRQKSLPHTAVRTILTEEKTAFSREIMKALVEQLSLYPLGTHVRLNTGEVGVVIELKPRRPLTPIIQISRTDAQAEREETIIDLSTASMLYVVEAVRATEVT